MKPVFAGSLADKVAAGLLFLILPLTQDIAAGSAPPVSPMSASPS